MMLMLSSISGCLSTNDLKLGLYNIASANVNVNKFLSEPTFNVARLTSCSTVLVAAFASSNGIPWNFERSFTRVFTLNVFTFEIGITLLNPNSFLKTSRTLSRSPTSTSISGAPTRVLDIKRSNLHSYLIGSRSVIPMA